MEMIKYPKQVNIPKSVASMFVVNMAKFPLTPPNRAKIIQMNDKIYTEYKEIYE